MYYKACYFIPVLRKLTEFEVTELYIPIKHRQASKIWLLIRNINIPNLYIHLSYRFINCTILNFIRKIQN